MTNEQFSQARALYENEGLSFADIGAAIGFSRQAIYNRFQKEGVPIRDKKASARLRADQSAEKAEGVKDSILMALEDGYSPRHIAGDLGLPIQTIKGIFATLPELTRRRLSYKGSDAIYTDEDLLSCLKYVAGKLGRVPGVTAYGKFRKENLTEVVVNQQPLPHAMTLVKRFDTWSAACKRAGFIATAQPKGLGSQNYDEAEVASAIRRVTEKLGHVPSIGEYQENCAVSEPSANTIIKRFGGWILALDEILD